MLSHGVQADREQLTQLAFEEFNMTGFFLCDQPILSLYAVGKITGTVVDIGHAKTGKVFLLSPASIIAHHFVSGNAWMACCSDHHCKVLADL